MRGDSSLIRVAIASATAVVLAIGAGTLAHAAAPDHVVIAIMENHDYSAIIGSASAPYINSLASTGALMTDSHGIGHPSEPNYLWLFSGSNQGITTDACPIGPYATDNLAAELLAASLTFVGYSEDLPAAGSTVCSSGSYWRKHNPWSDFSNVDPSLNQPFTSFPSDYTTLPTVSIVVPNQLHDMHDGTVAQGDAWLQANLDGYVQWASTHNSLFVLTWDENDGTSGNHIVTLFTGAGIAAGSYSQAIDHLDVLRTIEDLYGPGYAGQSASATPIAGIFASCGNGIVEGGEQCDTTAAGCAGGEVCQACQCVTPSPCSSGITLDDVSLSIASDAFALHLRGRAVLPTPFTGVDPPTAGIHLRIDRADGSDGIDAVLPGGAAWTTNAAGTKWTYLDDAGSIAGVRKAVVTNRSAKIPGQLQVLVKASGGTIVLPAPSDLRATVVFGDASECAGASATDATLACSGDQWRVRCR